MVKGALDCAGFQGKHLDENILNILVPIQLDLVSLVCCGLPPEQLLPGQSAQLLRCEWQEEQNFIDTSNELIALEVLLQQWQNGLETHK